MRFLVPFTACHSCDNTFHVRSSGRINFGRARMPPSRRGAGIDRSISRAVLHLSKTTPLWGVANRVAHRVKQIKGDGGKHFVCTPKPFLGGTFGGGFAGATAFVVREGVLTVWPFTSKRCSWCVGGGSPHDVHATYHLMSHTSTPVFPCHGSVCRFCLRSPLPPFPLGGVRRGGARG